MSARSVHGPLALFVGAMRSVLRELPRDGTGLRVDPTPAGHVTVTLLGPDGPLATCVVAQRAVPRGDGRQLTIDDVLARGAKPAAPAPRVEKRRETPDETAAPEAATPPAVTEGHATPAPAASAVLHRDQPHPACDDRASEAVAAGYEVSVSVEGDKAPRMEFRGGRDEAAWLARTAFYAGTFSKEIHRLYRNGRCVWDSRDDDLPAPEHAPEPGDTTAAAPTSDPATVADDRGADLGEDALALTPLWVAASEWSSLDKALRTELGAHVHDAWHREGDWYTATPYADASGFVYDLLCRAGVAVRLDPPPAPAPAKKPAKGKLFRDQGHALDRPHAHPNVAHLAGPGSEDMERPKGLDDAAWRAIVAQTVAGAPGATWRLYSAKGKCLWDSRDGGAP